MKHLYKIKYSFNNILSLSPFHIQISYTDLQLLHTFFVCGIHANCMQWISMSGWPLHSYSGCDWLSRDNALKYLRPRECVKSNTISMTQVNLVSLARINFCSQVLLQVADPIVSASGIWLPVTYMISEWITNICQWQQILSNI